MTRGRPRKFDRDLALAQATQLFWTRGYEATSIANLTQAMGINPPSLYSTFGDKRALFQEVVETYGRTFGAFTTRALEQERDTRTAFERLLREAAITYTDPLHPAGCLIINATTNISAKDDDIAEAMRDVRNAGFRAFVERISGDIVNGKLPAHTDANTLARFYACVVQGMSHQARDGATGEELLGVAEVAMSAWPAAASEEPLPARTSNGR